MLPDAILARYNYLTRTKQVTQLFTYLLTHKLFTSCIRRYIVSRACDWVLPALLPCCLFFSVQFSLLFFHVGSQAAAAAYVVYTLSDIERCQKCGKYVPCMKRTTQRNDCLLHRRWWEVMFSPASVCSRYVFTGDEVIKFWKVRVKGQGRWGSYVVYTVDQRPSVCPSVWPSVTSQYYKKWLNV